MPTTVSAAGMVELLAQSTDHVFCDAIVVHTSPVSRFVANTEDVVYDFATYTALAFGFDFGRDSDDSPINARLRIDNVSRDLVQAVRTLTGRVQVDVYTFRIDPSGIVTAEIGPLVFVSTAATITKDVIEFALGYQLDILNEPACSDRMTPGLTPALFG